MCKDVEVNACIRKTENDASGWIGYKGCGGRREVKDITGVWKRVYNLTIFSSTSLLYNYVGI